VTVLTAREADFAALDDLLARYGIRRCRVAAGAGIPGSFWGDTEAGLIGHELYVRDDTPLHSALHETAHYVCMTAERREVLYRDAGGGYDEENAVCYLQILLADMQPGVGRQRMLRDMDAWGYTFRLGSAAAWFERDAGDARHWLLSRGLIDTANRPTWTLNGAGRRLPQRAEGVKA
jgi:hypothetical protein